MAGVRPERIAAQTWHRDISVLVERYIRPLDALATTSAYEPDSAEQRTDRVRIEPHLSGRSQERYVS